MPKKLKAVYAEKLIANNENTINIKIFN